MFTVRLNLIELNNETTKVNQIFQFVSNFQEK